MYKKFVKCVYALKFKMNARRFANKIRGAMVELSDCGFSDGINGRMPNIPGLPTGKVNEKVVSLYKIGQEMYKDGYGFGKKMR